MRCLTLAQALELDRRTFEKSETLSKEFIERAGQAVFQKIKELEIPTRSTLALVGPGSNGADGEVVARLLEADDVCVTRWSFTEINQQDSGSSKFDFSKFDLVVDALFGVGLNRPLEGSVRSLIRQLNRDRHNRKDSVRPLTVISVDVPSGLDALTGWPNGAAVRADGTLTFQAAKPGFYQNKGPRCTGRLWIQSLPYPSDLFEAVASTHFACGLRAAASLLPRRSSFANKGSFGVVNLIAGSRKYPGAAVLCARAALRAGVGSVRIIQFDDVYPEWFEIPETLFEKWESLPSALDPRASWVVGPGLDSEERALQIIRKLIESGCEKVTLDATALNALAGQGMKLPASWILTPHPKELSRLLEIKVEDIESNRFAAAERGFAALGATILLKGYKTIVHHEWKNYICLRGNVALAKAGSGDVLAGVIGSARAQGLLPLQASVLGSLLHGMTADLWLQSGDSASLNPSDMIELLPEVQKNLKSQNSEFGPFRDALSAPINSCQRGQK